MTIDGLAPCNSNGKCESVAILAGGRATARWYKTKDISGTGDPIYTVGTESGPGQAKVVFKTPGVREFLGEAES